MSLFDILASIFSPNYGGEAPTDNGADFPGVTAEAFYDDEPANQPAQPLPQKETYTYSRENAGEELRDMLNDGEVIDAEQYGYGDRWYVRGGNERQ